MAVGTIADGATADAASAADGDVGVDTVPIPAATAFPNAGHVSSFLLHIRRRAADMDVDPAATADVPAITHDGPIDGTMAVHHDAQAPGASVAGTDEVVETVLTRKRRHEAIIPTNEAGTADVTTVAVASAVSASPQPTKGRKRTDSRGPAHAARRAAFLASQKYGTTDAT